MRKSTPKCSVRIIARLAWIWKCRFHRFLRKSRNRFGAMAPLHFCVKHAEGGADAPVHSTDQRVARSSPTRRREKLHFAFCRRGTPDFSKSSFWLCFDFDSKKPEPESDFSVQLPRTLWIFVLRKGRTPTRRTLAVRRTTQIFCRRLMAIGARFSSGESTQALFTSCR